MTENIVDYYGEDGLSTVFHDLLAGLEPGCRTDISFYASLLHTSPANILELGCGSGRVSLALAKQGHRVQGIDIAPAMLARAEFLRSRLDPAIANRVTFTVANMKSFSFPMKFDLIIAPYFALNHLSSRRAVMEAFARVAEHLMPGGTFALHIATVSRLARSLAKEAISHAVLRYDADGSKLCLDILERKYEQATGRFAQIVRYTMIRPDGTTQKTSTERLTYRAITEQELAHAAARVGLNSTTANLEAGETGRFLAFRVTGA
jgi:SAM-dependent methyltransferase